jgi:hypothetical protein
MTKKGGRWEESDPRALKSHSFREWRRHHSGETENVQTSLGAGRHEISGVGGEGGRWISLPPGDSGWRWVRGRNGRMTGGYGDRTSSRHALHTHRLFSRHRKSPAASVSAWSHRTLPSHTPHTPTAFTFALWPPGRCILSSPASSALLVVLREGGRADAIRLRGGGEMRRNYERMGGVKLTRAWGTIG